MTIDEVLELALEPATVGRVGGRRVTRGAMRRCRRCELVPRRSAERRTSSSAGGLLSILYAALEGAVRFNEFRTALSDVPPTTLSQRLRELERAGVLERRVVAASPPFTEYRLTSAGRDLRPMVEALERWTARSAPRGPSRANPPGAGSRRSPSRRPSA